MGRTFTSSTSSASSTSSTPPLQGERGLILRRENLYWSTVSRWRTARDAAVSEVLKERPRGPKSDPAARELRDLRRRNEQLLERLKTAEALAEAQGRAFALLQQLSRKSDDPT